MKTLTPLLLTILLCAGLYSQAQDTLKYRDGTYELVKVTEVNNSAIKYKKADMPEGPLFSVPKNKILCIVYQNGTRDTFAKDISTNKPAVHTDVAATEPKPVPEKKEEELKPRALSKSGPRFGTTYVGDGSAAKYLSDRGAPQIVTQIGYETEFRFFTSGSGFSGMAEFTCLLAGMEQGMVLLNGSILLGLRGLNGGELSVGPNFSGSGIGMEFAVSSVVRYKDLYFPVCLSFVPSVAHKQTTINYTGTTTTVSNPSGFRINLLIGLNTIKK